MEPESKLLKPVSSKLIEWIGPVVSPGDFPTFDISYETGETKYLNKNLDAKEDLKSYLKYFPKAPDRGIIEQAIREI